MWAKRKNPATFLRFFSELKKFHLLKLLLRGKKVDIYYCIAWKNPAPKTCKSPVLHGFANSRLAALTVAKLCILPVEKSKSEVKQKTAECPVNTQKPKDFGVLTLTLSQHVTNSTFSTFEGWKCSILPYLSADLCWDADKFWI